MKLFRIVLIALIANASYGADFYREECISRVEFIWNKVPDYDKENLIRKISKNILMAPNMGFNKIPPSVAIQGHNREYIFYNINMIVTIKMKTQKN